jgi:hypothetical protein
MTFTYSLCHTSARLPAGWVAAAEEWYELCDKPEDVEYILAIDKGDRKPAADLPPFGRTLLVENPLRRCAVDGWNAASEASTGTFLISVADDWFPCKHWDTVIRELIPNMDEQWVLDVSTGGAESILPFSMLTRKYYERLKRERGYAGFFHPGYIGMYADNDFAKCVELDGVGLNAKHLMFQHFHPAYGTARGDAIYARQHREEAFKVGLETYKRREANNFLGGQLDVLPRGSDQPVGDQQRL